MTNQSVSLFAHKKGVGGVNDSLMNKKLFKKSTSNNSLKGDVLISEKKGQRIYYKTKNSDNSICFNPPLLDLQQVAVNLLVTDREER